MDPACLGLLAVMFVACVYCLIFALFWINERGKLLELESNNRLAARVIVRGAIEGDV